MNGDKKSKQVIVIRKDLKMRAGKAVAQGAHASLKVFTDKMTLYKDSFLSKKISSMFPIANKAEKNWFEGSFTKICVYVNSEEELLEIYNKAKEASIQCSLVKDAGRTEFKEPTFTAVAVGPDEDEKIDKITGDLPLF